MPFVHRRLLVLAALLAGGCATGQTGDLPEDPAAVLRAAHAQAGLTARGAAPRLSSQTLNAEPAEATSPPRFQLAASRLPAESAESAKPAVETVETVETAPATASVAGSYPLTLPAAQCAAARHAPLANALAQQARQVRQTGEERKRLQGPARLAAALLQCQAVSERNKAAADAYALFYQLGELQQQHELLSSAEQLLEENRVVLRRIREARLPLDVDPTEIDRESLLLLQQRVDLESGAEQLAQALNVRIGKERLAAAPVIFADLGEDRRRVDVERAVAEGLACRSDLGQLRLLLQCVDTSNIDTAKQLLTLVEPALGALVKSKCECFACLRCALDCDDCCDVSQLRRQVRRLYEGAVELAEVEIATNAVQVNQAIRTLEIAEQTVSVWDQRVAQLEKLVENDSTLYLQLATTRADRLQAIGKVIQAGAQLELARGELLAAQGHLAAQCHTGRCCGSQCDPPAIAAPAAGPPTSRQAGTAVEAAVRSLPAAGANQASQKSKEIEQPEETEPLEETDENAADAPPRKPPADRQANVELVPFEVTPRSEADHEVRQSSHEREDAILWDELGRIRPVVLGSDRP